MASCKRGLNARVRPAVLGPCGSPTPGVVVLQETPCPCRPCVKKGSGKAGCYKVVGTLKDTLWVSAPSTLGLCVFPNILAVYACKLP